MATTVVKTIKSSGGDYTSLSGWEAGQQGNLVTGDTVQVGECYSMVDATQCVVDGSTTDATRYLRIYTPISERHNGTRSSSKYLMEGNFGSFAPALYVKDNYVRVEGLQFHGTGTSVGFQCDNCTNIRVSDCLAYDCGAEGFLIYQSTNPATFMNCAALHCNRGFHLFNADNISLYNCVAMGSTTNQGFWQENHTNALIKNCYSGGNAGADFTMSGTGNTWATSYSEDGTGTTTTAAYSTSSGCYFTNVTAGSEDPHIGSSSSLKDAGTDLSGDATWLHPGGNVDIIATARPQGSAWDVGVFELVQATAASFPLQRRSDAVLLIR